MNPPVRLYTVSFEAVAITAAQELFYLKPAADKPIRLHSIYLANVSGTADAGDAQEAFDQISIRFIPATVTASSGGTAPTPRPINPNDAAAGFTARVNDTTLATSSGTIYTVHADGWNERQVGPAWLPPPEHRILCANAAALVVRLASAPPDSISVSGTAYVEEII